MYSICAGEKRRTGRRKATESVPAEFKVDCHHWLILHGRYTALPASPAVALVLLKIFVNTKES